MKNKIGFYGTGNMGRAMIEGLIASKLYQPEDIVVYDTYRPLVEKLSADLKVCGVQDMFELANQAKTLIFAVKPNVLPELLRELKSSLTEEQLLVSVAAGVSIQTMENALSKEYKFVRVMPNTPAMVGEAMSAVAINKQVSPEEEQQVLAIFRSFGKAEAVGEALMDTVTGISGSGPAYVYLFIEALADGAVLEGMPRNLAYKFAAQTVLGAAKMVIETEKHPGELKDMVCSPGGTTIAAVAALEKMQLRSAVIQGVSAAASKSRELG